MPGYNHSQHRNTPYPAVIALDYVRGVSSDRKFGTANVGTSFSVVSQGNLLWLPTAATTIRVKAGGDAADDAAGTGAQQITVQGLDADGLVVSAVLTTNGISASTSTTQTFLRLVRAWVSAAGSGEVNNGDMTLEVGGGGTDVLQIINDRGQSETSHITVPTGKALLMQELDLFAEGAKATTFRMYIRKGGIRRVRQTFFGQSAPLTVSFFHQEPHEGITDIWLEALVAAATGDVSSSLSFHLYDTQ